MILSLVEIIITANLSIVNQVPCNCRNFDVGSSDWLRRFRGRVFGGSVTGIEHETVSDV
jgi:hypothetical protein